MKANPQLPAHRLWNQGTRQQHIRVYPTQAMGLYGGHCKNYDKLPFAIGGMEDHVHLLLRLPPMRALAKAVSIVKANSPRWMNEHGANFSWQGGYGAFSVSKSNLGAVTRYIRKQKRHHQKMSFAEEYRALLKRHGDQVE